MNTTSRFIALGTAMLACGLLVNNLAAQELPPSPSHTNVQSDETSSPDAAKVREVYEIAIARGDPDPCFYLPYEWARTECNVKKSAADQLAHQKSIPTAAQIQAREKAAWARSLAAYLSIAELMAEIRRHELELAEASAPVVIVFPH